MAAGAGDWFEVPRQTSIEPMEITLTMTGDYGVRAMLDVALSHAQGRRKTRQIAEAMNIPPSYLSQILAELVAAELLTATAGRYGGYELTRLPEEILLIEVVEVLEGEITLDRCARGSSAPRTVSARCTMPGPMRRARSSARCGG